MKNTIKIIIGLTLLLFLAQTVFAKDKYLVTVLPFSVHSSENIDYVRQGIGDMLVSRISASNKIEITGKDVVSDILKKTGSKELNLADVHKIGQQLKSDYVVWGSITKIGGSISIDGKLVDVAGGKSDVGIFTQSQSLDDVIPKINDFSQRIISHIMGTPSPAISSAAPSAPTPAAPLPPGASREAQIISGMKDGGKKGTLTSMINPDFINAQDPLTRKGFWMSQKVKSEFKGMDVGDVNKDGLNEIVVIDSHSLYIYQKTSDSLKTLKKIDGKRYWNYVSVDVADINKNGIPEIIVTVLNDRLPESFVLEYQDGDYKTIASGIRYFLRVIETPSGLPLLLGQPYGMDKIFDSQIYEVTYTNGQYQTGDKMKFPRGLSIYGLTLDTLGSGTSEKILALDELDYLCVISQTDKTMMRLLSFGFTPDELIWRSDVVYGGSNNLIASVDKQRTSSIEAEPAESTFANLRILTYDTNKDGKKEIIIVKNLSAVGRIFKNLKMFTSSEVYNLEWDGLGMTENWRTKKINGYIADYAFKDADNDGKPDLVLALVQSVGASLSDRSVVVIYQMDIAQ